MSEINIRRLLARLQEAADTADEQSLITQSYAAIDALQSELEAARRDAESWYEQARARTADAVQFAQERDAMAQRAEDAEQLATARGHTIKLLRYELSAVKVGAHILTAEHESNPRKALQDLLVFESDIAVDPRVSSAAARLVEQARAEEREACAKVCERERDALNENLQVWQENPTLTPCDEFISDWDSEAKIGEQYAAAIRARGQK